MGLNPLSPNIHMQLLQTDLYKFPLRISWENLIKDHGILSLMIILLILITQSLDIVWILLGENWCWSLLGLKGLIAQMVEHCSANPVAMGFETHWSHKIFFAVAIWSVTGHGVENTKWPAVLYSQQISQNRKILANLNYHLCQFRKVKRSWNAS